MAELKNVAFVFSGQGSQYEGMGKSLFDASPAAKAVFVSADEIRPGTSSQCFTSPLAELSITENTQPALYCVDLACAEALRENGIVPAAAAGFSLGEIAAIAFTGIVSKEDGFKIVTERGKLMQAASEKTAGAMAAVLKLSNEKVEELAAKYENVYPVNYNCPGQLVVAGEKSQLEAFCADVAAEKGRAKMLNVSGGFHSPFMNEAADGLRTVLAGYTLNQPEIKLYSDYTAKPYSADDDFSELLVNQVKNPVRWQQIVENMIADGIDTFVECGAGKTLTGLIKKINKEVKTYNVQDADSLVAVLSELKNQEV